MWSTRRKTGIVVAFAVSLIVVSAGIVGMGQVASALPAPASLAPAPNLTGTASSCAVGSIPEYPGFDPVNHEIYVPNYGSGNVSVKTTQCKNAGSIALPSGAQPSGAIFQPIGDLWPSPTAR